MTDRKKVAFICVHNSCRSQIAVRLVKEMYHIDMEKNQYSKLLSDIPGPDIAISMGCNVGCPFIGRGFKE